MEAEGTEGSVSGLKVGGRAGVRDRWHSRKDCKDKTKKDNARHDTT
jgi:hypothetical protein